MNSTKTESPLAVAALETGLEISIQEMLVSRFTPFLEQTAEWRERAESLVVTDINQTREMKMAREARLALREIRINADKLRKELKEDSLRYGRAVQGVYNVIETNISPIEKHLEAQEKFKEIYEMKQREAIRAQREALRIEREALTFDVRDYMILNINLGEITQDDFEKLHNVAKIQKQDADNAAEKAEAERIERMKAEAEERERMRLENEQLKAEAVKRETERRAELDRIEFEQRKANIEAARIRKEADEKVAVERAELERLQSELRAKVEAEQRAEAERIAAIEVELGKGDKAKFDDLISDFRALKTKYEFKSKKHKALYVSVCELIEKIMVYISSKK